jgi:hypothetical protein
MSNKVENRILAAGFAQFPKGTTIYETQKVGCILVIDIETKIIKEADFTFISKTTNDFLSALIIGKKITGGIDSVIETIDKKVFIPGKKAVIQSVINAYKNYDEGQMETKATI